MTTGSVWRMGGFCTRGGILPTPSNYTAFHFLILTMAGWMHRDQVAVIEYLIEENRDLRERLNGRRIRLTDVQRRRLARKGKAIGRRTDSKMSAGQQFETVKAVVPRPSKKPIRKLVSTPAWVFHRY
jgi:hypothetical protein